MKDLQRLLPAFKGEMEGKYGIEFTYQLEERQEVGRLQPDFYLKMSFDEPNPTLDSFTIRQIINLNNLSYMNATAREQIVKSYLERIEREFIKLSIKEAFNLKDTN